MERLFDIFRQLVEIPSPSLHENQVLQHAKLKLMEAGIKTVFFDRVGSKISSNAPGNLFAFVPPTSDCKKSLLLCAHADTVLSKGKRIILKENDLNFYSDGESILGADDLSGVAILLEIAQRIKENHTIHGGLWLLFTIGEERGSLGTTYLNFNQTIRHQDPNFSNMAIMYDWEQPNAIIFSGIGKVKLRIEVAGHYAKNPNKALSALVITNKVLSLLPVGLVSRQSQTSLNIGYFSSGAHNKTDQTPNKATVELEIRSQSQKTLTQLVNQVKLAFDNSLGSVINHKKIRGSVSIIPMQGSYRCWTIPKQHHLIRVLSIAISNNALPPICVETARCSDGDILNDKGIKTIGLGCGMHNSHSNDEILVKDEFLKAANIGVDIIKIFNNDLETA